MVFEEAGSLLGFGLPACAWPMALLRHGHPALSPRLISRSCACCNFPSNLRWSCAGGGRRFSQRQVEEVKLVLRLLPVFATTSLYWTIYMQARWARCGCGCML